MKQVGESPPPSFNKGISRSLISLGATTTISTIIRITIITFITVMPIVTNVATTTTGTYWFGLE